MSGSSALKANWWGYRCGGRYGAHIGAKHCTAKDVAGAEAETLIGDSVSAFLQDPAVFMAEMEHRNDGQAMNKQEIEQRLTDLERQLTRTEGKEQELIAVKLQYDISEEAFKRSLALIKAERSHITEEVERQRALLAAVRDNQAAVAGMLAMRENLLARLEGATPEEQRWVMQMLNVRVTATESGYSVSLGVPPQVASAVLGEEESVVSFLSCRPWDTLIKSGGGIKAIAGYCNHADKIR